MSKITLSGNVSGSGTLLIAAPNTSSDITLNLPTTMGTNNGSSIVTTNAAGNLGLGVAPSAWGSNWKAFNIGSAGNGVTGATNAPQTFVTSNSYYDGSSWRYGQTGAAGFFTTSSGVHSWHNAPSGTAGAAISFVQAMTLDASGNLGVGTTSPTRKLQVAGAGEFFGTSIDSILLLTATGVANTAIGFNNSGSTNFAGAPNNTAYIACPQAYPLVFGNGATERARIDSSGNLLVGKTSPTGTSGVGSFIQPDGRVNVVTAQTTNGYSTYELYSTGAGAYRFYVGAAGTVFATNTTITGISDVRLKENIRDLDDGLDVVLALKPRKFDWKEGKGADIKNARGFIAQEFETVFPDLIDEWKDPAPEGEAPYKAVRADLIPTLVKAIQELHAIVAAQGLEIATLTAAVAASKGQA